MTEQGERIVTEEGNPIVLEDDFFRLSHVGFENQEARDVIKDAIKWWHQQLDEIEAKF